MSEGRRWPLAQAREIADRLAESLRPACLKIEVAGSIRRRKPDVGDIEIVLLPRTEERPLPGQGGLFDAAPRMERVNLAWETLDPLLGRPMKGGERMRCYLATEERPQIDIFSVADPRSWGNILAIRTGPASFSKGLVVSLLKRRWAQANGLVWDAADRVVPCPEEEDFFRACGRPWVRPEDRK